MMESKNKALAGKAALVTGGAKRKEPVRLPEAMRRHRENALRRGVGGDDA